MAFVKVPKDLTKVKNKVVFNLTKRQLICFGIGACCGFPLFFATRDFLGNSNAAMLMIAAMVPAFLFAMYEKDGMHLEKILMNIIRVKWIRPAIRTYETKTFYEREDPPAGDGQISREREKGSRNRKGGTGGMVHKKEKRRRREKEEENDGPGDDSLSGDGQGRYL